MPMEPVSENFELAIDGWDEIPVEDAIPEGTYELLITKAELVWVGDEILAAQVTYAVGQGEESGTPLQPFLYMFGEEGDERGTKKETRNKLFGWKNWKKLCNAVGVRYDQLSQASVRLLVGKRFIGVVSVYTEPAVFASGKRKGESNQYAGQQRNRMTAYYPLGYSPQAQAGQVQRNGVSGSTPTQTGPQPQRRMTAAEALAAQAQVGSSVSGSEDSDIPF